MKNVTDILFGFILFFIIDRIVRFFGSSFPGPIDENKRCQMELALLGLILSLIFIIHFLKK
jgi:hypothetical protein